MIKVEHLRGNIETDRGSIQVNKLPQKYIRRLMDLVGDTLYKSGITLSQLQGFSLKGREVSFSIKGKIHRLALPKEALLWRKIEAFQRRTEQVPFLKKENSGLLEYQKKLQELAPSFLEKNERFLGRSLGVSVKEISSDSFGKKIKDFLENLVGKKEVDEALYLSDSERIRGAFLDLAYTNLSYLGYACSIADSIIQFISHLEEQMQTVLGQVLSFISGISAIFLILSSSYKLYKSYIFRSKIDYFYSAEAGPKLTRKEKALGVIRLLYDQIYPTEEEKKNVELRLEKLAIQGDQADHFREVLFSKMFQRKAYHFSQKMGGKAFYEVLMKISSLEEAVLEGKEGAIQEVEEMVSMLKKENNKKCVYHALILITALIGLISAIALNVATFGIPILVLEVFNIVSVSLYGIAFIVSYAQKKQLSDTIQKNWDKVFLPPEELSDVVEEPFEYRLLPESSDRENEPEFNGVYVHSATGDRRVAGSDWELP